MPSDALDIGVNPGDLVGVIQTKDPMGNSNRWFVDNGKYSEVNLKDTNRKIRKTMIIYIYGSLIGSKSGSISANTGERMLETQQSQVCTPHLEPKITSVF